MGRRRRRICFSSVQFDFGEHRLADASYDLFVGNPPRRAEASILASLGAPKRQLLRNIGAPRCFLRCRVTVPFNTLGFQIL